MLRQFAGNIAYGRLGADEAAIMTAARRARLEEVIEAPPQGLDTATGERDAGSGVWPLPAAC